MTVLIKDVATGVEVSLNPTQFSVTGVGGDNGNVVLNSAPATGKRITLVRDVPYSQEIDLEDQGAFYASTVERGLDLAAMRDQQINTSLDRAYKVPYGDIGGTITKGGEGRTLVFDANGDVGPGPSASEFQAAVTQAVAAAASSEASAAQSLTSKNLAGISAASAQSYSDTALTYRNQAQTAQAAAAASAAAAAAAVVGRIKHTPNIPSLKNIDSTVDKVVVLTQFGREGTFVWVDGNFTTAVASDPLQGVYIKANARPTTEGAWYRIYEGDIMCNWFGCFPDCVGQGTGTDVMPAIEAAIKYAVANVGHGATITLEDGRYRGATPRVVNLAGLHFITLNLKGCITPDFVAMALLTIRNGFDLKLRADIMQGGVFYGYGVALPFGVDYSNTANVIAAGGQEAFRLEGIGGCDLDLRAFGYAGRLLRTTGNGNASFPRTGGMRGTIFTTRNSDLSKARTAQSLWADQIGNTDGGEVGIGYWGTLERITNDFDGYGPVWRGLNDIMIGHIDAAYGISGPVFQGCSVVKLGKAYVGDLDGWSSGRYHLAFISLGGAHCHDITIDEAHFLNGGDGLNLENVRGCNILVKHAGAGAPGGTVCRVRDTIDGNIHAIARDSINCIVDMDGLCDKIDLVVENTQPCNSNAVLLLNGISASAIIRVKARLHVSSPWSGIGIVTNAYILIDADLIGPAGASGITIQTPATAGNRTRLLSGTTQGGMATFGGFQPQFIGMGAFPNQTFSAVGIQANTHGWNEPHLVIGSYHIWGDANGDLRYKSSAPTGPNDGRRFSFT